jgi:DNA-binding response OmpR family regulator
MKDRIYIYSNVFIQDFFKKILLDYNIYELDEEHLFDDEFKNNNVIFIIDEELISSIKEFFFSNNNVLVLYSKKENKIDEKKFSQTTFLNRPIKIKQFLDAIKTCFFLKTVFYKDIKISEQKIINLNLGLNCSLTSLETKILYEFVENKKIKRDYFLENIFKIKKDIETKTIESHLTRIRKKLLKIKSDTRISSKDDVFYLED